MIGSQEIVKACGAATVCQLFGAEVVILDGAPVVRDRQDTATEWAQAFVGWLDGLRSESTRRAYQRAWQDLLNFAQLPPWKITASDMSAWVEDLSRRPLHPVAACRVARDRCGSKRAWGYSRATINQYLSGISSFYTYVMTQQRVIDDAGQKRPLHATNPAVDLCRPKVTRYGHASYLRPSEARAFLGAIPQDTVQGLRDYALFLTYLATGRHNSEVRMLRWADFVHMGARVYCLWGRGGSGQQQDEVPLTVWTAIVDYLRAAKRLEQMRPNWYVFVPLSDQAIYLPTVDEQTWQRNHPLSIRQVGVLVKRYARAAGLDPVQVRVGTLRHTAAMLRKQVGGNARAISAFLGHAAPATTRHYLQRLDQQTSSAWTTVETLLGL